MLKAFPWKTMAVLRGRFTWGPQSVMSYHTAAAWGWELSLVSGLKSEQGVEKCAVTEFPLWLFFFFFLWQIIFHPPRPQPLSETLDQVWRTEVPTGQIL